MQSKKNQKALGSVEENVLTLLYSTLKKANQSEKEIQEGRCVDVLQLGRQKNAED